VGVIAEKWLRRLLVVVHRNRPELTDWRVDADGPALDVNLELRGVPVALRVSALGGKNYATTASLSWAIRGDISRSAEAFVREFLEIARRADPGDLVLPKAAIDDATHTAPEESGPLTPELHRAAWRAVQIPLYGITVGDECRLGEEVETEAVLDGWRRSLEYRDAGIAPYDLGLYIHVPFCARACTFCHCSFTDDLSGMNGFTGRLIDEMQTFAPVFSGQPMTSVFFGGGTPSMLSIRSMKAIFEVLYDNYTVPEGTQIAFECNPDSFNERKLEVLVGVGRVNRLTLGVQAFDPVVQKLANRFNKPEQVSRLMEASRAHGVQTINIDLMVGLAGQEMDGFQRDVESCIAMEPDALHLMPFHPDPWTPYSRGGGVWTDDDAKRRRALMDWGRDYLEGHGYTGAGARANQKKNRQLDDHRANGSTLGFGVPGGAHSWGGHYYAVSLPGASLNAAIARYNNGPAVYRAVEVSRREEGRQQIIRDFRRPFALSEFARRHGADPDEILGSAWRTLVDRGVFRVEGDQVEVHVGAQADLLMYRALLYDAALVERIDQLWADNYDTGTDYREALRQRYGRS